MQHTSGRIERFPTRRLSTEEARRGCPGAFVEPSSVEEEELEYIRTCTYLYGNVRVDDQSRERSARSGGTRLRSPESLLD